MLGNVNRDTYDVCKKKIESGFVSDALDSLTKKLLLDQCPKEYYELASSALISSLKSTKSPTPSDNLNWPESQKKQFYLKLIRQDNCDCDEHIFLKTITAHQSTGEHWVIPAVAKELEPVLSSLHTRNEFSDKDVLCLIILRNFITAIPQDEISEIHLRFFPTFTQKYLSLAYSTIFDASEVYNRNIKDIGKYIFNSEARVNENKELKLYHILLIVWLYTNDRRYPYELPDLIDLINEALNNDQGDNFNSTLALAKTLLIHHVNDLTKHNKDEFDKILSKLDDSHELPSLLKFLQVNQNRLNTILNPSDRDRLNRKLDNTLYKSAMACKNIIAGRLGLRLPGKRPKVAVCISGQLRGYKHTFDSWKKSILKDIDYDIFIHSWVDVGRSGAEPSRKSLPFDGVFFKQGYRECFLELGFDELKRRYPTLFKRLHQSGQVDEQSIKGFFGAKAVVLENDKDPNFADFTNSEKMHYKIKSCNDLYKQHNQKYDLILRIRPDVPIPFIGFDWKDIYNYCYSDPVIFADSAYGVHYMNLMIGDQFAVGRPEVMDIYTDTWNIYPKLGRGNFFGCPNEFKGHVSLALTCWTSGINVKKIPMKKGALKDSENMNVNKIFEAINTDATGRSFSSDEKLLGLLRRDGAK